MHYARMRRGASGKEPGMSRATADTDLEPGDTGTATRKTMHAVMDAAGRGQNARLTAQGTIQMKRGHCKQPWAGMVRPGGPGPSHGGPTVTAW